VTKACFEPALDYIVVKMPRWDLQKFRKVSSKIGSGMKSVGEVMAIGRKFEEALQKALRMLDNGADGLIGNEAIEFLDLDSELSAPTPNRIFAIAEALQLGYSVERIHQLSNIDEWFLEKISNIVGIGADLKRHRAGNCPERLMANAKRSGFSDRQIGNLIGAEETYVRSLREAYGVSPCIRQIDTLAAEYPAQTNYLYLTYNGQTDDETATLDNPILVLGGGPYRIGSSVEFDWCCVNAVRTLRTLGYKTVIINCNPETVSTDYNECDKLYFEELTLETVMEIYSKEKAAGIIVSMGGQAPNNLALALHEAGLRVLGTSPLSIDAAEDRHKFSALIDEHGIQQPEWKELVSFEEAVAFANRVGYPVLVRPSYVLSGSAMAVASNHDELRKFLSKAAKVSRSYPVLVSKFLENAKELEMDAVARKGEVVVSAISEHVENAGVHSGDATLVLPPQRTYLETIRQMRKITDKIARVLDIDGPFNIQFIAKGNDVKVIECNLRASRSFPFVSKISKFNFIDIATKVIVGMNVPKEQGLALDLDYVGVKAPHFSFTRLEGADPTIGVEMSSTGEVACLGDDFEEAFLKALLSVGYRMPIRNILLSTGPIELKAAFLKSARELAEAGMNLYATKGTADFFRMNGIPATTLHWPLQKMSPNVLEYFSQGKIDLVINIPKNFQEEELTNDYLIRRRAVDFGIPLITNIQLAQRFAEAIVHKKIEDLRIKAYAEYAF
jgi:carbamoyl-phosphate synthase large subunit